MCGHGGIANVNTTVELTWVVATRGLIPCAAQSFACELLYMCSGAGVGVRVGEVKACGAKQLEG